MSKKSHFETLNAKDTDFLVKLLCVRGMVPAKLFEETAKKLFHDVGYNDKIAGRFQRQIQQHTTAFNTLYYQLRPALIIIKLRDRVIFQLHVHEHVLDDDDDDDGGPYSEEYLSGIV